MAESDPSSSSTSTTSTTSPMPSTELAKDHAPTTTEIVISIASVASGVLLILILVYVIALWRRRKYQHAQDRSEDVESPRKVLDRDNFRLMSKPGEVVPFVTPKTDESLSSSKYQSFKSRPSSFVNSYESLATHENHAETHIVPLDLAQSPQNSFINNYENLETQDTLTKTLSLDHVQFPINNLDSEFTALDSTLQSSIAPLRIPEKPLNRSNGKYRTCRSEADDAASVYSEVSTHFPEPSVIAPPVPLHFTPSTQSTLHGSTDSDVIEMARRRDDKEEIIKPFPLPSLSPPPSSFQSKENVRDEAEEDENEIFNVARLLLSRQTKLPKTHPLSRHASTVSHIERSGSIRPVILSGEEQESYRPRYYRLKQKKNTYAADLSSTDLPNPFMSTLSPPYARDSQFF